MSGEESLFGDWKKAKEITGSMAERWQRLAGQAVLKEANYLRGKIVAGLREQAPGGQAFKPLSPLTLAVRSFVGFKGTKALIRRGDLRNAIVVKHEGEGANTSAFVGVLRTASGKGGESMVNVAEENEFGAGPIVVPITPKSRRFYFAALAHAGIEPPASAGGAGAGLAVAIVRIPARPFMRPVFAKECTPEAVRLRFYQHVIAGFAGDLGK